MTDTNRPKVTSIELSKRSAGRFDVHLDGEYAFSLPGEAIETLLLAPGRRLEAPDLAAAHRAESEWRVREAALRLLSHRPRTESELRTRLQRKGFDQTAVDGCIAGLLRQRLLDDHEFACSFIRERTRSRPRGPGALLGELRTRGIAEETAKAALKEVWEDDDVTEIELARRAADRFLPRRNEDPAASRRRLFGLLGRKGFTMDVIRTVAREREDRVDR